MSVTKGKPLPEYTCPLCVGHGKTRIHLATFTVRPNTQGASAWSEEREAEIRLAPGEKALTTYRQITPHTARTPLHTYPTERKIVITGESES